MAYRISYTDWKFHSFTGGFVDQGKSGITFFILNAPTKFLVFDPMLLI